MTTGARVGSIDAVKEFRSHLVKFYEAANGALGDADSDVTRTLTWLETQQISHWTSQIRKRQEILARAEEALRYKRIFKDPTGRTPSAVDEQKAVDRARKDLGEAREKHGNTKSWIHRLQKEISLYHGGVARFTNDIATLVPTAIAQLGTTIEILEKYIGLGPAPLGGEVGEVPAFIPGSSDELAAASMARSPDDLPETDSEPPIDAAAIRAGIPSPEILSIAQAAPAGLVTLACPIISEDHRQSLAAFIGSDAQPSNNGLVYLADSARDASAIFIVRLNDPESWLIVPLEPGPAETYNTLTSADLLTGRPDLAEMLKLPIGIMAVITPTRVTIFDQDDRQVMELSS